MRVGVYLGGEFVVGKTLGSRPLDGELGPCMGRIRIITHQPRKTKVSNLHQVVFTNKTVPSSQIPVNIKKVVREWYVQQRIYMVMAI